MSQCLANGLIAAAAIMLVAISFQLIYRVVRFFHFAHAAVIACGAFSTFALTRWGIPFVVSVVLSIIICALLGCGMYAFVYHPLRRRGGSSMVLLLASLGLYTVIQNVISLLFGDEPRSLLPGGAQEGISVWGARITWVQLLNAGLSVFLVLVLAFLLKATRAGRVVRAIASDEALARVVGVEVNRYTLCVFAVGSGLAGAAGILMAFDVAATPMMGMSVLLMGVVAVIVGGIDSTFGAAFGALLIGMAQHLGVWRIGAQWQETIVFAILVAFLLVRPEGFLGKRVRKATV